MCGIFGIVNGNALAEDVLSGLSRLQYRGYDSAGLALVRDGEIVRRRAAGKLSVLEDLLEQQPVAGRTGIAHTRWATHGGPTVANAHPHATERVAVVHNGIIENHAELRQELCDAGYRFQSETDTEVVAPLVSLYLAAGLEPREAVAATAKRLEGEFALAFVFRGEEELVLATRRGSPLVCADFEVGACLSSDALALAPFSNDVVVLADGDVAELSGRGIRVFDAAGHRVERPLRQIADEGEECSRGDHETFTHKEIYEQPTVLHRLLASTVSDEGTIDFPQLTIDWSAITGIELVACGTSRYAGMVAREWFEQMSGLPTHIEIASEYRARGLDTAPGVLRIFISQSGETADTLGALRDVNGGLGDVAVVNVQHSALAREADAVIPILAGPEIGVASTKAFTAQLMVLAALSVFIGRRRGRLTPTDERRLLAELDRVPGDVEVALETEEDIRGLAVDVAAAQRVLFVGRGPGHGLALEAALKLKELSYIHAEAFAAGELKHGPIALVDKGTPVIACAPPSRTVAKVVTSADEVSARGAAVSWVGSRESTGGRGVGGQRELSLGNTFGTIACAIPLQLLAYHVARESGCDVDQPRNLAKSVTVE